MKKYEQVYDNVKHLTPMKRMMLEQAARKKAIEDKLKQEEKEKDGNSKSSSRKPRTDTGTDK